MPDILAPFRLRPAAELARARVDAALERYKTQLAFYQEGRITVDRLVDASRGLMQAERDAAGSKAATVAAVRSHFDQLGNVLKREQAKLEAGRATEADVSELHSARLDAEFALAAAMEKPEAAKPGAGSLANANRRIDELELKVDRLIKALDAPRR